MPDERTADPDDEAIAEVGGEVGREVGREVEPDVRFTYANERTFLAWNRTALALIATGVAIVQLVPKFEIQYGRRVLGLPLIALGAYVSFSSLRSWRANDVAMRYERPLPRSHLPVLLSAGITVVAIIAALLAAFEHRA